MLLRLSGEIKIEDLRGHPRESVDELRALLARGIEATAEHLRKDFYEIEADSRVFYIHICPGAKVLLLAIWGKESKQPVALPSPSLLVTAAS